MAITFGSATAPSQKTVNFDALFTLSLANSKKILVDAVSSSMALLKKIMDKNYESVDGGTNLEEPLMYELGTFDTYDGYDQLSTDPTDGITKAIYEWSQAAIPVTISRKEERQNAQRIMSLLETKITQATLGIKEGFAKMMLQGNKMNDASASIMDRYVSPFNGSLGIHTIPSLVRVDPTTSTDIGNINQSTNTWWRNQFKSASAITTSTGLLQAVENLYNTCANGVGGSPDLIVTDQITWELLKFAMWKRFQHPPSEDASFPFENFRFRRSLVVYEEYMINAGADTLDPTTTNGGTLYMLNTKFFKLKYDSATNFINTPFKTPINQDAKVSHILWMGQLTVNNRRKHGVLHTIPRTLTLD